MAGPGAMSAAILLMANAKGDIASQVAVMASLIAVLIVTLIAMLLAGAVQRVLGVTGMHVVSRIMGVLLSALAVQFMIDGVLQSELLRMP